MILKKCKKQGCRELVEKHKVYCNEHKDESKHSEYNRNRWKFDKEYKQFYDSKEWKRIRKKALQRDNYCCQKCRAEGLIVAADLVHHIVETKVDWEKRLELDNLESICTMHHEKLHNRQSNKF